ncbi:Flagellin FlgL [Limimonas halophila]|uniref:Flagellin FlgL n=1 Tax=Limimonas halophila TaxID=1082479 RepID=A0A1G7Q536_9PROT|nr:flagellin [Limimonas halophila]SDF93604.1 Flagellin FlgL [Limimonas halophila]
MVSAIGTFAAQRLQLQNTLDVQSRMEQAQIQLSSGKVSQSFDGVSQDARRLLDLERSQVANNAFQQNVKQADLRMEETANVVDDLEDIASRFQQQLVAANTDTNVENLSIQSTAQNFREEIEGLLNTDVAGRHLFSGTAVDQQAVSLSNASLAEVASGEHFNGNGESIETRATENLNVESNVTADPLQRTGIQELVTAATRVAQADQNNLDGAIEAALDDLNGGQAEVSTNQISLGTNVGSTTPAITNINFDITDNETNQTNTVTTTINSAQDTIQDVVQKLNNDSDFSQIATAKIEQNSGESQVVVQSNASNDISISSNGGGNEFAAQLNFAEDEQRPGAIERLAETSADIGSRRQTLTETLNRLESDNSQNEQAIGDIENVDVTEAATEMSALQNTLQASFASTARLQNLSILNFLR